MKTIGEVLREQREFLGLTRKQVAQASGVSESTLANIETGVVTNPSFESVVVVAEALDITADDVVDWVRGGE